MITDSDVDWQAAGYAFMAVVVVGLYIWSFVGLYRSAKRGRWGRK